jgi:hypothetical protein
MGVSLFQDLQVIAVFDFRLLNYEITQLPNSLLVALRSGRSLELNSIHTVGLFGRRNIKIGKRHFLGSTFIDDPQGVASYSIILHGNFVSITKYQNGIGRWLLRRH